MQSLVCLLLLLVSIGAGGEIEEEAYVQRRLNAVLFSGVGEKDKLTSGGSKKVEPCVKFGGQFDVPLQGTNVVLDCPSASGVPNKKVCCAAHFPTQVQAVQNGTFVSRNSVAPGYLSASSRGVGWSYEVATNGGVKGSSRRLLTSLTETDLANAAAILKAGKASARVAITCTITKQYHSSPQELRDLAFAKRIARMGKASLTQPSPLADGTKLPQDVHNARLEALLTYVTSDEVTTNSTRWLERVRVHMQHGLAPLPSEVLKSHGISRPIPGSSGDELNSEHHADDFEFLSRFEVTKICSNGETRRWNEWIEPLTITARHPFGFSSCRNAATAYARRKGSQSSKVGRSNVDYVLLQSGRHLHAASDATSTTASGQPSAGRFRRRREPPPRHVILDAGTSTFDSSLYWFTCGYSQRGVSFDSVHAWEMTMLNPRDYWAKVPNIWKPYWHFYNTPISADPTSGDNPLQILKNLRLTERDFVAFKLDIDHPETEMPIALSLLDGDSGSRSGSSSTGSLVDEFFFELHFRCEVMTSCGWGKKVPASSHGLTLDRPSVLQFFIDLRNKGIRAHIWP